MGEVLAREVARAIREMIRKEKVKTGQRIVDKEICRVLGVSRTPLREALQLLHAEGLVNIVPRRGAFVSQPSIEDIREMFVAMSILEGVCARMAVENMTERDLAGLRDLHDKMEAELERGNTEAYFRNNNAFHVLIQEMSRNKVLINLLNGLREKIMLYRFRSLDTPERLYQSQTGHREIQRACEAKDAPGAEVVMRDHIMRAYTYLKSRFQASAKTR